MKRFRTNHRVFPREPRFYSKWDFFSISDENDLKQKKSCELPIVAHLEVQMVFRQNLIRFTLLLGEKFFQVIS